jgi:hypothetical protein
MGKVAEKAKYNESEGENFGDYIDIEYIKPDKHVNMRNVPFKMPKTFSSGFEYMKKLVKMVRLGECDVD